MKQSFLLLRCAALAVMLAASGCAAVLTPMGAEKYDCNRKENPDSPYCHSFKSVEAGTNAPLPDSRFDQTMRVADVDRLTGIAPTGNAAPETSGQSMAESRSVPPTRMSSASAVGPELRTSPLDGVPVRVGPLVQRVWIKSFVDSNDMLVTNTYVYKEIEPTRWAGFDGVDRTDRTDRTDRVGRSASQGAYPHRPILPAASTGAASEPARSAGASRAAPRFSQPGTPMPGGEMAPAPAMESGASSLPQ